MKELFTIGEISDLFNINKKTLRYYDEIDLFKPNYIDKRNNYRYYTVDQFEQLNTIKYLKELAMPLNKIKAHLENVSVENIMNIFQAQKKITEEKIKELKLIEQKIQNRINQINNATDYSKINIVTEIEFQDRHVVMLREKVKSNKDLELSIRKLENVAYNNSSIFLGKVGISISKENLKNKVFDEYNSTFIFTEGEEYNKDFLKVLQKGVYLCIRFNGTHNDSKLYYEKLLKVIDGKGYEILQDPIEITLIDYGLTRDESEFVTEIQILVKKH